MCHAHCRLRDNDLIPHHARSPSLAVHCVHRAIPSSHSVMPAIPGEPKESPKPQPMGGNMPMIFLITTCTLCFLFILWRRASALRSVISHQLKTITNSNPEGAIRLSEDDGPPAREFLEDDYDDDNEGLDMDNHDTPLPGPEPVPGKAGAVPIPPSPWGDHS
ncbi:hypothetical protein B0H17DRAFT_1049378 [Mycena rosella]|uniref:Uncharacterized protein n=1 Tax=Mycena rosella TaxID=1033263 RepID=A0AAD7DTE6_MYCRO|nr:hypothetical protein B0H17DRAFT_1049378 [Mycena rosella]